MMIWTKRFLPGSLGLWLIAFSALGLLPVWGAEVRLKQGVDLRQRSFELGLYAKNQGRRPSCAVFAILGVLEFYYSAREEGAVFLSEEFLIWATSQINPGQADANGFSFVEVMAAIETYGVARADAMPNALGGSIARIVATEEAQQEALGRREVRFQRFAGSNAEKVEAIIRELNAGFPVAVALRWPPDGVVARVHTLRDQPPRPDGGHAVAIIGYCRPDPASEEILFLFRNSYGLHWGVNGCGYVSDRYLKEHLFDAVSVAR